MTAFEIAQKFYVALRNKDVPAMLEMLNEDSVFAWNLEAAQGPEDIIATFEAWWATVANLEYSPLEQWAAEAGADVATYFLVSYDQAGQGQDQGQGQGESHHKRWNIPVNTRVTARDNIIYAWLETGYEPPPISGRLKHSRAELAQKGVVAPTAANDNK